MNLIDQIAAGENAVQQNANEAADHRALDPRRLGSDHSFAKGDRITTAGLAHIRTAVNNADGYRGLGVDVTAANNNVDAIREIAGLGWNPVKVPAAGLGKTGETVAIPNQYFLFKSGTREPLPVPSVTDAYIPHTNSQLLGMMSGFAEDADLRINRVASLDGGARIVTVASSDVREDVAVGDTFALRIVLQSGHGGGVATRVSAQAFRLLCNNGAMVSVAAGRVSIRHNTGLTILRIEKARDIVLKASEAFQQYVLRMRGLYQTPATPGIIRLALAQYLLSDDQDWARVVRNVAGAAAAEAQKESRRIGADVIERILAAEASRPVAARMFAGINNARLLNAVIEATDTQVGAAQNRRTLGHAHNGMTYYGTHVRGRNAESALKSNLDRDDAKGFMELLEQQYVPAVQQVMGVAAADVARMQPYRR